MTKYEIELEHKIENCSNCPFCYKNIIHEGVNSMDKLTGVIEITKVQSICILNDKLIISNKYVYSDKGYEINENESCPLNGKFKEVIK